MEMRDVEGFEGLYKVSDDGRVYSVISKKILKPKHGTNGYENVALTRKDGTKKYFSIHRLVATAFIKNPYNKPSVDHINRNKKDNRACNLRWATPKEQMKNVDIEKMRKDNKNGCKRASEVTSRPVAMIGMDDGEVKTIFASSFQAAAQLFGDKSKNSLINRCAHHKKKSAYGYKWEFVEGE